MKAVILAGGLGLRLRPFTQIIPKPLLPIGERSLLEIQISQFKKYGFNEIFLATNFQSNYIKNFLGDGSRYGVKLYFSEEKRPLGTAGPLSLLKSQLTEPFIVMNGDILSTINFAEFYQFALSLESMLCAAIKKIITPFSFGKISCKGNYIRRVEEKPNIEILILAGIYFMKPEILQYIPENQYFGIDLLIKTLISNNQPVGKYNLNEYWLDIGQIPDLEKAQEDYNKHFANPDDFKAAVQIFRLENENFLL